MARLGGLSRVGASHGSGARCRRRRFLEILVLAGCRGGIRGIAVGCVAGFDEGEELIFVDDSLRERDEEDA